MDDVRGYLSILGKIGILTSKSALLQIAHWALFISVCVHSASGEEHAIVVLQSNGFASNAPADVVELEVQGQIAGIGIKQQEVNTITSGTLRMLPNNCSGRSTSTSNTKPFTLDVQEDWIGVIYLPPLEDTRGTSGTPKCSLLDQVKQAMLFGASALLVLAMNPALFKELDVQQFFSGPIVLIQGVVNVSKVQKAAQSSHKTQVKIKPSSSDNIKQPILSTAHLTLWSTCGRSIGGKYREWDGTVCLEAGHSYNKIYFSGLWNFLLSLIGTLSFLLLIHSKWRSINQLDFYDDVEDCLQRLAKASISKMPARKCKKKKGGYSTREKDCAVCLDEFIPGQLVRVLPCYHQFHCKCVDAWLIKKRTCPLCKLNIVDQRFSKSRPES